MLPGFIPHRDTGCQMKINVVDINVDKLVVN
jgi:hypothetical protein